VAAGERSLLGVFLEVERASAGLSGEVARRGEVAENFEVELLRIGWVSAAVGD